MSYPPPPFDDALTGLPVSGSAITGVWWAYPPPAGLRLRSRTPNLEIVGPEDVTIIVGARGMVLGNRPVSLPVRLVVGQSRPLVLYARRIQFRTSIVVPPAAAGLLLGGIEPDYVGQAFLMATVCR